jgi:voltage-gated hydrogen channel 1
LGIWYRVSLHGYLARNFTNRGRYLRSKFHIFDAIVIVTSFVVEVTLQGVTEEIASLIVILRLLRVVKIVDELSVGAEEQMRDLEDRLSDMEKENHELKEEVKRLRTGPSRTHYESFV